MFLKKGLWSLVLPALLTGIGVLSNSALLLVIAFFMHFFILKCVPVCKRRENIWMFIMVAVSSVPINAYVLVFMGVNNILFEPMLFLGVLRCILYYGMLFSLEELIMGILTRAIWKKQYKIKL